MSVEMNTTLNVEGMTCSSCVRHISDALKMLPGVKTFNINMGAGQVSVMHDGTTATIPMIVASLEDAGYLSRPAEDADMEELPRAD